MPLARGRAASALGGRPQIVEQFAGAGVRGEEGLDLRALLLGQLAVEVSREHGLELFTFASMAFKRP